MCIRVNAEDTATPARSRPPGSAIQTESPGTVTATRIVDGRRGTRHNVPNAGKGGGRGAGARASEEGMRRERKMRM